MGQSKDQSLQLKKDFSQRCLLTLIRLKESVFHTFLIFVLRSFIFSLGLSFANKHPFFFLLYVTHPRKNHWLRLTGFEGLLGTLFDSKDKKERKKKKTIVKASKKMG